MISIFNFLYYLIIFWSFFFKFFIIYLTLAAILTKGIMSFNNFCCLSDTCCGLVFLRRSMWAMVMEWWKVILCTYLLTANGALLLLYLFTFSQHFTTIFFCDYLSLIPICIFTVNILFLEINMTPFSPWDFWVLHQEHKPSSMSSFQHCFLPYHSIECTVSFFDDFSFFYHSLVLLLLTILLLLIHASPKVHFSLYRLFFVGNYFIFLPLS